jgi:hypothetical protein
MKTTALVGPNFTKHINTHRRHVQILCTELHADEKINVESVVRSKASVCGRSMAGTVGSNPTGGMDVCLL